MVNRYSPNMDDLAKNPQAVLKPMLQKIIELNKRVEQLEARVKELESEQRSDRPS